MRSPVVMSDFPVRKQHALSRLALGVTLVMQAQIGPAHAVAARHETAERVLVACLAAHRHAPDAELRGGGLYGADRRLERTRIAGRELQDPHFVARASLGERRRVP